MGKSTPSPPPVQPIELPEQPDFTPMMSQMVSLMELMLMQQGGTPDVPELPQVDPDAADGLMSPNWDEQIDQIRTETEAEVREDLERRRGVEDTVVTSPLLEYEEPTLLTGGSIVGS